MTYEELRLWCDAQGMSYPGTVSGLLTELVKQRDVQRDIAVDQRNQAKRVYTALTEKLDELGVARYDDAERPFDALKRLVGLGQLIEGLKGDHPKVAEECESDTAFLAALVGSYGNPVQLEDVLERMKDPQLARIAGLASAELLARRMSQQMGGGILGGGGK